MTAQTVTYALTIDLGCPTVMFGATVNPAADRFLSTVAYAIDLGTPGSRTPTIPYTLKVESLGETLEYACTVADVSFQFTGAPPVCSVAAPFVISPRPEQPYVPTTANVPLFPSIPDIAAPPVPDGSLNLENPGGGGVSLGPLGGGVSLGPLGGGVSLGPLGGGVSLGPLGGGVSLGPLGSPLKPIHLTPLNVVPLVLQPLQVQAQHLQAQAQQIRALSVNLGQLRGILFPLARSVAAMQPAVAAMRNQAQQSQKPNPQSKAQQQKAAKVGSFTEVRSARVTSKHKITNPDDDTQFVKITQIDRLLFKNKTGQTITWHR